MSEANYSKQYQWKKKSIKSMRKWSKMDEEIMMLRGERRSFFCPNKLWKELLKQTNDCISVSTFIKQAIVEKMIKDNPEKKEIYKEMLF